MAECNVVTTKEVHLILTEKEALYLKDLTQNFLGLTPDESEDHTEARKSIWTALDCRGII